MSYDKLNDDSLMPNGQFEGEKMEDVPDAHLIWIYENDRCKPNVRQYILENLDAIRKNAKENPHY